MAAVKKKPKPFSKERREFLFRVLNGAKPVSYRLEMTVVTKVFEMFNNDLDFLSKVKPPHWLNNTLVFFLSEEGKEFLNKKYQEFKFKIPEHDKFVDLGEKFGDDVLENKPKTLREFLK